MLSGFPKIPRSPTPSSGKNSKTDTEGKRKTLFHDERDLPISLLADANSMFIACQGLTVHYKLSSSESPPSRCLASSPFHEPRLTCSPPSISSARHKLERPFVHQPKTHGHHNRSFSFQFQNSSLYVPLLEDSTVSSTFLFDEIPVLNLDKGDSVGCLLDTVSVAVDVAEKGKFAVVLVHGFGGGVFSWRHVMGILARQIGCTVVAFDRPGWGLTSRPRRKDWEDRQLPNPYTLDAQVIFPFLIKKSLDVFYFYIITVWK